MPQWIVGYPVLVGFNCAFFFLYFYIDSQFRKHWPNIRELQWAAVAAFVCLCVPYVFGYYLLPYEMTSGAKDAGQGVGIFLGFVAPIGAGLLASIGWLLGKLAGRNIF
jgi:hypothetical protein